MFFIWFYWVLLGFTGFHWVLLGFTGFYWVLLGFTGFHWVLLGFTGLTRVVTASPLLTLHRIGVFSLMNVDQFAYIVIVVVSYFFGRFCWFFFWVSALFISSCLRPVSQSVDVVKPSTASDEREVVDEKKNNSATLRRRAPTRPSNAKKNLQSPPQSKSRPE